MKKLISLLFVRPVLFLFFQAIVALLISSWIGSVKYWTLVASLTNIISIILMIVLMRQENLSYSSLFRFDKKKWKGDLAWFSVFAIISVPLAIAPSLALSKFLWGNTEYYHQVLFQPLNRKLLYLLLFVYPVSTGFAELPTYFGYIMPRLKVYIKPLWLVPVLPALAFSIQHCTLPLLFEPRFIFFRGVMYLLFILTYGIAIYRRPSLLLWLSILQVLIYILPMTMLLTVH